MMISWIEAHPSTVSVATAFLALLVSIIALIITIRQLPNDPTQIIRLVEEEARLARAHDVKGVLELYAEDAVIVDAGLSGEGKNRNPQYWQDKEKIRERYEMIREHAVFPNLRHTHVRPSFDPSGNTAWATSSTEGSMKWDNGSEQNILTIDGESWDFVKVNGNWKIKSVRFHGRP